MSVTHMATVGEISQPRTFVEQDSGGIAEAYLGMPNDDIMDSGRESSGPDEAVFDNHLTDGESSPGTSHHSDDNMSDMPESRRTSYLEPVENEPPLTPPKQRSPFRNPSSVRAIQLDTTPPHLMSAARYQKYRMSNVSRNTTPKSVRSHHSMIRSGRSSPTKSSKKVYPLVLLHVTLMPVTCPYSQSLMESILPIHIIENWKLLREKIPAPVLDRGILIPHPREDYDLLEERLLESLELKSPRILKCGHFYMTSEEEAEIITFDDEYGDEDDCDKCEDCGRRIRDDKYGTGVGQRRWSIKVYASNGLMRAGAWNAAWREMERVDVEILPWIDDELRRELEARQEQDLRQPFPETSIVDSPQTMDEERRREIYGNAVQPTTDDVMDQSFTEHRYGPPRSREVPLSELLLKQFQHALRDRRNLVIALLSLCVLHLAMRAGSVSNPAAQPIAKAAGTESVTHSIPHVADVVGSRIITNVNNGPLTQESEVISMLEAAPAETKAVRGDIDESRAIMSLEDGEQEVESRN